MLGVMPASAKPSAVAALWRDKTARSLRLEFWLKHWSLPLKRAGFGLARQP